ncbi:MAG: hypothetical protein JNJ63_11825 [Hyphomonadaceae bacterium]|nr:hypothetical protein [Hyphomonadaceae bacterium]
MKKPDLSEQTWIGAAIIAVGGVGAVVGIAAIFSQEPNVLLAIGMGSGWALFLALLVSNSWLRRRVSDLEADLLDARNQAATWAETAKSVSDASLGAVNTIRRAEPLDRPSTQPPKRTRKPKSTM